MFLKTAKTEENYAALPYAKLYTVIYQTGRSFGGEKRTNANILLFQLNFSDLKLTLT